jgi:hypothetical protein
MYVKVTFRDIFDADLWDEFCDKTGTNPWAINEGLASMDDEVYTVPDEILMKLLKSN